LKHFFQQPGLPDAVSSYKDAKYVVFGVPFDSTSSYRRGSRLAPAAIRYAYRNLEAFDPWYGIAFPDLKIADLGDLTEEEDARLVVDTVESVVSLLKADGKIPIMLGGEHSITTGAVRNFKECSMVIIDAHSDFRRTYFGNEHNHACVTHRSLEILGPGRIFSVGTRSTSREEYEDPDYSKVKFYSSREVDAAGIKKVADEIDAKAKGKIYFSIDMDGIDPAEAPGVGTPEPYGISARDLRLLLSRLAKRIVGFDIVEMTPLYDNGNTAMLAAKIIQDFLGSSVQKK
jgi:arginase/agmatinase